MSRTIFQTYLSSSTVLMSTEQSLLSKSKCYTCVYKSFERVTGVGWSKLTE